MICPPLPFVRSLLKLLCVTLMTTMLPAAYAAGGQVVLSVKSVPVDIPPVQQDVPQAVHVYLDRVVYTDRDRDGQGLVVINPPALLYTGKLAGHKVRVWTEDAQGKALGQPMEATVNDSDHFALDLDIPQLPMGAGKIRASLINSAGQVVVTGEKAFTKQPDKTTFLPSLPKDVPLVLTEELSLATMNAVPITTGIPLPEGLLDDETQVSLFEDGREIPCQTTVRARWTRRGSIKWLGLDFQARYVDGQPRKYTLRLGQASKVPHNQPVILEETDDAYTLTNGVVKLTLGRKSFRLFDRVVLDRNNDGHFAEDETLVEAKATDGPYWENAEGKVFYAALDKAPVAIVEEAGPMRTTLRFDGWLTAEDGSQAGRYTTRVALQAGKSQAAVNHTFTITWNTTDRAMRIADIGVRVSPLSLENSHQVIKPYYPLPETGTIYQLFDRQDSVRIVESDSGKILTAYQASNLLVGEYTWLGGRTPLAFGGYGKRGGIAVSQRYIAEKFPKEIQVGRDTLSWHAWPRHGTSNLTSETALENLSNLHWLHQGKLLDFQIPDDYFTATAELAKTYASVSKVTLLMYKDHDYYATGTAITGELLYTFDPDNTGNNDKIWRNTGSLVHAFEANPQAIADPTWAYNTQLLEFAPPVAPEYPEIEEGISTLFDMMIKGIVEDGLYGQFLWPNGKTYTGRTYTSLHRNRINAHHGSEIIGWMLYLRSGEKKYWTYANTFSRYLIDHASANWDPYDPTKDLRPTTGAWPGSVYHCQGFVPWSKREPELIGHMSPQWHACLYYFITGDTQALDLAKANVRSSLKAFRTAKDYRVREPYNGYLNRNPACGWGMLTSLYTELQDPRLLRVIGDMGDQIFIGPEIKLDPGQPPDGQTGKWWFYPYLQQWRDPAALEAINNISPFGGQSFGGYNTTRAHTTGDPTSLIALWFETQGLGPLRQYAFNHPAKSISVSPAADNFNFLLPMIAGMREFGLPEAPPLLPIGFDRNITVVMREDTDRDFTLQFWGPVYEGPEDPVKYKPMPYTLHGPDGQLVLEGLIDRKALGIRSDKGITIHVPKDGKTGQYTLRLSLSNQYLSLMGPISDLPREVYVVPAGSNLTFNKMYWRTNAGEMQRTLSPHAMRLGENYTTGYRLTDTQGQLLQHGESTGPLSISVLPQTGYYLSLCVAGQTTYAWRWKGVMVPGLKVSPGQAMILSIDESRWFEPIPEK